MKKKIFIILIFCLLLSVGLSGCTRLFIYEGKGTVIWLPIELGFWGVVWDCRGIKMGLDPVPESLPEEYRVNNLRIKFKAKYHFHEASEMHMWGIPVYIIEIQPLNETQLS